jgi:hypothetical protein
MNIKLEKANRRGTNMVVTMLLTITAALAIVFGARAVEVITEAGGGTVWQVPGDYATIQAAIDAANSGDIIEVGPGEYNESLILNKAVTLVAKNFDDISPVNNNTILNGGGRATTISIPSGLSQMPTIRGFVIWNSVDGIQAASPFIAEFNFLHSANNLISYQLGGGGFNRNNVYFGARDNAIRLDHTDRPLLIENNRILYSGKDGIEISLQNVTAPPAMVEVNIWNNMIIGNGDDGVQLIDHMGVPQDTNRRFIIAGNLIANNKKAGLGLMPFANTLEDYSGADMLEAVRVYNNTFYGNDHGISGGENLVAFNNIIANTLSRGIWRVQGVPGANSVVAYSLFHNNRLDADQSILGVGNLIGVDPLFEAAPNAGPDGTWATVDDDFSGLVLRSDSPAIDKGVAQFIAADGKPIPPAPLTGFTGSAPDLGWREVGAPLFMTPTPTPLSTATAATLTPSPTFTSTPGSPTLITETPTLLPTLTTTSTPLTVTASPTVTNTATQPVQLLIQSVDPNNAQANTTLTVIVTGSGFQEGALVTFEGGQGLPQEIMAIQVVNSTMIVITMNAHNDGAFGIQTWDIRVTNPDTSTIVLPDAFTVVPES